MNRILTFLILACTTVNGWAQQTLTLDSCRAMALRSNRQLAVSHMQQEAATNIRKAARTKYLPHVTVMGGYEWMSKEVSILNNSQKSMLNNLGTNAMQDVSSSLTEGVTELVQRGVITPQTAMDLAQMMQEKSGDIAQAGNTAGQRITSAFRTDTRNLWAASAMLTQPLFMGGAITALNRMADIQEAAARDGYALKEHALLYEVDEVYWLVVSLKHKQRLAQQFHDLVSMLNSDVEKMIAEGVATKADGLKVSVRLNESEMALTQVDNGLSLARMLLCQKCGLPLDTPLTLADEDAETLAMTDNTACDIDAETAISERPETHLLQHAVDLSREATHLARAANLPQVLLTGGYMVTNPNVYDGYTNKFAGAWNIGVMLRIPVWDWFEGVYRVRATKAATAIAQYELAEAKEKMSLQVSQQRFKVDEAGKRLVMAEKNIRSAEENLRCANVGFKEGVMQTTDVIAAQTAWQQAQSQKIDAEIEVRMSQMGLKKALGKM